MSEYESKQEKLPLDSNPENCTTYSKTNPQISKPQKIVIEDVQLNDFFNLGRYTYVLCLWLVLIILNQLGHAIYMMFAGAAPKIISCGKYNFSEIDDQNEVCIELEKILKNENCTPEMNAQFKSINLEFGYFCQTTSIVKSSITYQMVGLIIGALIFGQISDMYGRKPTLLIAIFIGNIFNIASSFSNDLFWFTVLRFFVNLFNAGSIAVLPIYSLEMLPPKDRFWINNVVGGAPVFIAYALVAYFSREWRTLARVISVLVVPAFIVSIFINESPRYLIQKGRISEAKAIIKRIHRIDKREFDETVIDHVLQKENKIFLEKQAKNKKYSFVHLFYTPNLTRYSLAIALSFFTTSLMNYALMFNIENIAGSIYINLCLTGVVRYIIGGSISILEVKCKKIGRKTLHFTVLFVAAICFMIYFVVIITGYDIALSTLLRLMALVILGFIGQLYIVNGICTAELFPTSIRNLSYSFGQFANRIGVTLSPQVFLLAQIWKPLPYVTMFFIVLFDMLFFHFNVKETKNKPLSDHMPGPEENWSNRRKYKKKAQNLQKGSFIPLQKWDDI